MLSLLKSEAKSLQRDFEIVCSANKKHSLLNLLFVSEFAQKQQGESNSSGLKEAEPEEFTRLRIDRRYATAAIMRKELNVRMMKSFALSILTLCMLISDEVECHRQECGDRR